MLLISMKNAYSVILVDLVKMRYGNSYVELPCIFNITCHNMTNNYVIHYVCSPNSKCLHYAVTQRMENSYSLLGLGPSKAYSSPGMSTRLGRAGERASVIFDTCLQWHRHYANCPNTASHASLMGCVQLRYAKTGR